MFLVGSEIALINKLDIFILRNSFLTFATLVLMLTALFRWGKMKNIVAAVAYTFCVGIFINLGISTGFMLKNSEIFTMGVDAIVSIIVLPMILFGLLSFFYVGTLVGTYESSIRLRIIRELSAAGEEGLSWEELLKVYNEETILKIRLDRLITSREFKFDGTYYHLQKKKTLFSWLEGMVKIYRRLYSLSIPQQNDSEKSF